MFQGSYKSCEADFNSSGHINTSYKLWKKFSIIPIGLFAIKVPQSEENKMKLTKIVFSIYIYT